MSLSVEGLVTSLGCYWKVVDTLESEPNGRKYCHLGMPLKGLLDPHPLSFGFLVAMR